MGSISICNYEARRYEGIPRGLKPSPARYRGLQSAEDKVKKSNEIYTFLKKMIPERRVTSYIASSRITWENRTLECDRLGSKPKPHPPIHTAVGPQANSMLNQALGFIS